MVAEPVADTSDTPNPMSAAINSAMDAGAMPCRKVKMQMAKAIHALREGMKALLLRPKTGNVHGQKGPCTPVRQGRRI